MKAGTEAVGGCCVWESCVKRVGGLLVFDNADNPGRTSRRLQGGARAVTDTSRGNATGPRFRAPVRGGCAGPPESTAILQRRVLGFSDADAISSLRARGGPPTDGHCPGRRIHGRDQHRPPAVPTAAGKTGPRKCWTRRAPGSSPIRRVEWQPRQAMSADSTRGPGRRPAGSLCAIIGPRAIPEDCSLVHGGPQRPMSWRRRRLNPMAWRQIWPT